MTSKNGPPHVETSDRSTSDEGTDMTMDPKVQEVIGKALRAYTDDIIKAPVPDKFLMLLAQLEAKEKEQP